MKKFIEIIKLNIYIMHAHSLIINSALRREPNTQSRGFVCTYVTKYLSENVRSFEGNYGNLTSPVPLWLQARLATLRSPFIRFVLTVLRFSGNTYFKFLFFSSIFQLFEKWVMIYQSISFSITKILCVSDIDAQCL